MVITLEPKCIEAQFERLIRALIEMKTVATPTNPMLIVLVV